MSDTLAKVHIEVEGATKAARGVLSLRSPQGSFTIKASRRTIETIVGLLDLVTAPRKGERSTEDLSVLLELDLWVAAPREEL